MANHTERSLDFVYDQVQVVLLGKAAVGDQRLARVAEACIAQSSAGPTSTARPKQSGRRTERVVRVAQQDRADFLPCSRARRELPLERLERLRARLFALRQIDPDDMHVVTVRKVRLEAVVVRTGAEDAVARVGQDRSERVED